MTAGVSPDRFRAALSHLAAGVTVITTPASAGGDAAAMTATAFCSVSLDPPLVLVSVGRASRFHPSLLAAPGFAVCLLAADQREVAVHFADSGRDLAAQFDEVEVIASPVLGAPVLTGALAWLECRAWSVHEAGDHTLVIGLVVGAAEDDREVGPLTYHRGSYTSP